MRRPARPSGTFPCLTAFSLPTAWLKTASRRASWPSCDVISEREEFLLREFQKLLEDERLLEPDKNVVVVAAPVGWETYKRYHVYVCKANRSFGRASYLAFYGGGEIKPIVPVMLKSQETVEFVRGQSGEIGKMVDKLLDEATRPADDPRWHHGGVQTFAPGEIAKIVLLSKPDDRGTIKLPQSVKNDKKSASGKSVALTQWQTYVSLPKLQAAKATSELD